MLTGESNLARAARAVMETRPARGRRQAGRVRRGALHRDGSGFFALPGFPLEDVRDPTGAGDSFAGGFLGYLDSHEGDLDEASLRRAMGYGTVLASFNVEEFGTERVSRLTREEIDERWRALHGMTQFERSRPPPSSRSRRQRRATGRALQAAILATPAKTSSRRGDGHRAADQERNRRRGQRRRDRSR